MNKIQKFLKYVKSDLGFFIFLLVFITILFTILSPKISSLVFPTKRQILFNNFVKTVRNTNQMNGQTYWEFREFYSPGYFTFSETGIEKNLLKETKKKINVRLNEEKIDLNFLVFSSPHVSSLDMLTKQTDLSLIIPKQQLLKENIIFINKNSLIYKESPKNIKIIFLLSNSEMRKANGFFDYLDKDKKITEGENWLNITSVNLY